MSEGKFEITFVDDMVFVANRPIHTADDTAAVLKQGFRSMYLLNESASDASTIRDALTSKGVIILNADSVLTELVDSNGHQVEKFAKDVNEGKFDKVVSALDSAPRPTLVVSCASARSEAALAVVNAYCATRLSKTAGLKSMPAPLREFLEPYVETKMNRILTRLPTQKYEGGIWAAAQPTLDDLRRYAALGARSVVSVRDRNEAGKVGLGVLVHEPRYCAELNLDYYCVPVANANEDTIQARVGAVRDVLKSAPKPVVFHCATRGRIDKLLAAMQMKPETAAAAAPAAAAAAPAPTPAVTPAAVAAGVAGTK